MAAAAAAAGSWTSSTNYYSVHHRNSRHGIMLHLEEVYNIIIIPMTYDFNCNCYDS